MSTTVDEFWEQYAGQPYELIQGEVFQNPDKGYIHEIVTSRVKMCLEVYADMHYLGEVLGSGARFALADDELRAVDVAFIGQDKLAAMTNPDMYLTFAPDLLVEVVSPRFTSTEIQQKVDLFMNAGTPLVWVVDPTPQDVTVFYRDGNIESFSGGDLLQHFDVLPKLSLRADDLFPPLGTQLKYP